MSKHEIELSIIVTTYNVEKYIDKALSDVLNQTFKNFEVIVVDDGSTDKTKEIILSHAKSDKRIVPIFLLENSPGGVATAANVGLNHAKGKWVGFADGDDLFEPTMFEKLLSVAESSKADFSVCRFMEFDTKEGKKYEPWDKFWNTDICDLYKEEQKNIFLKLNPVPWRKLYRRDFLDENNIRFKECEYFFEDNSFHWFVTLNAHKVAYVDEALCYHRMNRIGQTMQVGGIRLLGVFFQFDVIKEYLEQKGLYSKYKLCLLQWLVGQSGWIADALAPKFIVDFYQTLSTKLLNFSKKEVRCALKENYGRKVTTLIVAAHKQDLEMFKFAIQDRKKGTLWHRLMIKSYQYGGVIRFLNVLIKEMRNKRRLKKIKIESLEERMAGIQWELSQIRKLMEINAIHQESLIEKMKNDEEKMR